MFTFPFKLGKTASNDSITKGRIMSKLLNSTQAEDFAKQIEKKGNNAGNIYYPELKQYLVFTLPEDCDEAERLNDHALRMAARGMLNVIDGGRK
jgi:hypothetical protein